MLVVLFHLHEAVSRYAAAWLWAPVDLVARYGYLGVDIFFVISGFVIALSVSKGVPSLGYFARFILRRSIRLDPPYWTAILLECLLLYLTLRFFIGHAASLPSPWQLLAHVGYVQNLLGYGNIVDSFWTLCYEIQFYAFFVSLVVLWPNLPAGIRSPGLARAVWAGLFLLSLWVRFWRPAWLPPGVALDRWFQFSLGTLTYLVVASRTRLRDLVLAWVVVVGVILLARAPSTQYLVIVVSLWLVLSARQYGGRFLSSRPLQFLGTISYSIYLYHASIGWRFVTVVQEVVPAPWSPLFAVTVYLLGTVLSVGVATALWWLIERPCLRLSQRVKLPLRRGQASASVDVPAEGSSALPHQESLA